MQVFIADTGPLRDKEAEARPHFRRWLWFEVSTADIDGVWGRIQKSYPRPFQDGIREEYP